MDRRWVCLATLGPIGVAALVYVVVMRGFVYADVTADHGLAWPLLGALPLFVFGMWLLTVSASRIALLIALGSTSMLVGSAYETFVHHNLEVIGQPWFPLVNVLGLTADAVATSTLLIVFATFPDGVPERRWQRIAVVFLWTPVLVGPLTLLTSPHVVMSQFIGISGEAIPNPYFVPWLEWADPAVQVLVVQGWVAVALGLVVLASRSLFGEPEVRARTRVMALTVAAAILAFALWTFVPGLWGVEFLVYASMIAIPVAAIHGILRYGAFDIGPGDRGARVERSSNLLITVVYSAGVATPALLLAPPLSTVPAILLTTLLAVVLLPARSWMQRRLHRALFGDRERQFTMLSELGAQLEQAGDPRELLTRLAEAVRDGLDASWVQIRLVSTDPALGAVPVASLVTPSAGRSSRATSCAATETSAHQVGPRRRVEYGMQSERCCQRFRRKAASIRREHAPNSASSPSV